MFIVKGNKLVYKFDDETLSIEPYGKDSLRVRSTKLNEIPDLYGALLKKDYSNIPCEINIRDNEAEIKNGDIKAVITHRKTIKFLNSKNEILLEEYIRQRAVTNDLGNEDVNDVQNTKDFSCTLKLFSREFKPNLLGDYNLTVRFESDPKEKIYGMGQYQHEFLDLKNCTLELAQRNSQCSVPFYVSSKKYGFLWNNAAIGEVSFSKNITIWNNPSTKYMDYVIISGENSKEILEKYTDITGRYPKMPKNLLGLWQSKMRYQTQEEVLDVVKKYEELNIKPSVMVIDFFHWTEQGHYDFDKNYWPNPKEMVNELEKKGIKTMISVWPTISVNAKNYLEYVEKGLLIRTDRGVRITMNQLSNTVFLDVTNPASKEYLWNKLKHNYYDQGIKMFWLDVAEPGYAVYDFDNFRYYKGNCMEVGNIYPLDFAEIIYNGLKKENENNEVVSLVRCAFAGSQRYGALVWSGDIDSSFKALKNQINTGLNMGLAGIAWWTTDIGGFHGGDPEDKEFRELMIRWFEYAVFSPILRMHGDRIPHKKPLGTTGGGQCVSGADNEIWSYGKENQEIFIKYIRIREGLTEYLDSLMQETSENGSPIMRTMFYEFDKDEECFNVENQYMLGSEILVAPILEYKARSRMVYIPKGCNFKNAFTGELYEGGKYYTIDSPIDQIPVFYKEGSKLPMLDKYVNHSPL